LYDVLILGAIGMEPIGFDTNV